MKRSSLLIFLFALIAVLIVPEQVVAKNYLGHYYFGNLEKKVPKGEGSICIGGVSRSLRIDGTFDGQNVNNATVYICTGYIDKNNSTTFKGDVYFDESENITLKVGGTVDIVYYVWDKNGSNILETKTFTRVLEKDELVNLDNFEPSEITVDLELPLPEYVKIDNTHDMSGKFVSIPVTMNLGKDRDRYSTSLREKKIYWDVFSMPRLEDILKDLTEVLSIEDEKGGKWTFSLYSKANEELFENYASRSDYSNMIKDFSWNWQYNSSENWIYQYLLVDKFKDIQETAYIIFPDTTSVTMTCYRSGLYDGKIERIEYEVQGKSIGYKIHTIKNYDYRKEKIEYDGYTVENGVVKKMEPMGGGEYEPINWINYWKGRDTYISLCEKGEELDILNSAISYDHVRSTSKEKVEDMLSLVLPHLLFVKYDSDKNEYSTTLPSGNFMEIQLNGVYFGHYYDGKYLTKDEYLEKKFAPAKEEFNERFSSIVKRFGFDPSSRTRSQLITSGRSFKLLVEWFEMDLIIGNGTKTSFSLSIDHGSSKCYDIISTNLYNFSSRRVGFVWVSNDKVTSVTWY